MNFKLMKDFSTAYDVVEGCTITQNYNETLDSAVIRIAHLNAKIDIEPFDECYLYDNRIQKFFCVDSYTCAQDTLDGTTYTYEISLFSQTKLLENYLLPNISITPLRNNSDTITYLYINGKRTVYYYMLQYLNEYGPKKLVNGAYVNKWSLSSGIQTRFGTIVCPETQWNQPTLREVLNTLAMYDDCIITLNNDTIGFLDLTNPNPTNISTRDGVNYITESQNSSEYESEIRMNLQNVMQTNVDNVNNVCTTTEYLTFTTENYIMTTDNIFLKTQFPILNIKHLWICILPWIGYSFADGNMKFLKVDLCNISLNDDDEGGSLIKEKDEFNTLEVLYRIKNIDYHDTDARENYEYIIEDNIDDYYSKYQNYCLYYTRGSNIINGFTKINKSQILSSDTETLNWIKVLALCSRKSISAFQSPANRIMNYNSPSAQQVFVNTFFQIEYETTANCLFQAGKSKGANNYRAIFDNQTNSWADAYLTGNLAYQKANRLGNKQLMINERVTNTNYINLGDIKDNYIVYRTQYQIYKNHIDVNAYATENYILQDYFTGIQNKVRTWVNAKDEAFERHDLQKYYCEFSKTAYNEVSDQLSEISGLGLYMLSGVHTQSNTAKPIKYCIVNTCVGNPDPTPESGLVELFAGKFALNVISRLIGNSIVFTFGFEDNAYIGKHIYKNDATSVGAIDSRIKHGESYPTAPPYLDYVGLNYGGVPMNNYSYVEEDEVEYYYLKVWFQNELNLIENNTMPEDDETLVHYDYSGSTYTDYKFKDLVKAIYQEPLVRDGTVTGSKFGYRLNKHKDNKEKPMVSTQFEFRSDTDDIRFTKKFIESQDCIRTNNITNGCFVKTADSWTGTQTIIFAVVTMTSENVMCGKLVVSGIGLRDYVFIYDADGNLLLSFKGTTIYLNIRRQL